MNKLVGALAGLLLSGCSVTQFSEKQTEQFFVGSYTSEPEQGIYLVTYDVSSQTFKPTKTLATAVNPGYLNWQPKQNTLYSIAFGQDRAALVHGYIWEHATKSLQLIEEQVVAGNGICHLSVDAEGTMLATVNYSTGDATLFDIQPESAELKPRGYFKNSGSSLTFRQEKPHLHYAGWEKQGRFLYIADLGTDEILVFDTKLPNLELVHRIKVDAGDGPRHLSFHPTENLLYSVNELSNSISVFKINSSTGELVVINKIKITEDKVGKQVNLASAIRLSNDGNHLYVAIRGEDKLYGYQTAMNGELSFINSVSSGGKHPRDFNFSSLENFLLVTNQHSNLLSIVERDQKTGVLTNTNVSLEISSPSFVQAVN